MNDSIDMLSVTNPADVLLSRNQIGIRLSERKLLLVAGDLFLLLGTLYVYIFGAELTNVDVTTLTFWVGLRWLVPLSTLWLIVGTLFGIYELQWAGSPMRSAWLSLQATLVTQLLFSIIPIWGLPLAQHRSIMLLYIGASVINISIWRIIYTLLFSQPVFNHTFLIIGNGQATQSLIKSLNGSDGSEEAKLVPVGLHLLGIIDDVKEAVQTINEIPVLGHVSRLNELVERLNPSEVIVAVEDNGAVSNDLFQAILDAREHGTTVTSLSVFYERVVERILIIDQGNNLGVVLPVERSASFSLYKAFRRAIDILIALVGCFLVAIIVPVVWFANRVLDPGDLFYRQTRVGQGGRLFEIIKFRSMVMDAEKYSGAVWAAEDDPRITVIGRFLRRTRLDEIPQFWNILQGDMSLIGPRPERPHFVKQLSDKIPSYRTRHALKPGLTGWAQVKYRYGASVEDSLLKLQYDLYYVKHQSAYLDVLILINTIRVVLGMQGR